MKKFLPIALVIAPFFFCSCNNDNDAGTAKFSQPAFNPNPTAEYLSPEESLKTFSLPEDYHLELVASEPMIKEPVAIAWDGNGRLYVAEMLTYMQDADATGEQVASSRISRLEDTDGDGKMDKSTVFIDSLLLPRMMQCVGSELLVNETNTITINSYSDTNGDGKADVKKTVYENDKYTVNDANMEHQRSGLDYNLDNWMYVTYDPLRFRYVNGKMKVDSMVGSNGQWGVTHDNYGRVFYSRAGGEIPAIGFQINPSYGSLDFPDQYDASFAEVWPIIATPDVQGGVLRLREDKTLNHFTAPCGQSIYRGDKYPADFDGDYIVCEPVARAVRRANVVHENGKTYLTNVYNKQEFISSSDMNFRPVNSATGPDGNLYIVDMHRGIIQQGNWTKPGSFLRQKIDSLGMAKNVGHGRIYRVVHNDYKKGETPKMLDLKAAELIKYLDHKNGWWRDNAQKEIIAKNDKSVIPALKKMALGETEAGTLGRIHAIWTLEGLEAIDKVLLKKLLEDDKEEVRKTAVWVSEPFLRSGDQEILKEVEPLVNDKSDEVKVQLLLSLSRSKAPAAKELASRIVKENDKNEMLAATHTALEKAESVRNFGAKMGNLDESSRNSILKGMATFKSLCASCHGPEGKGLAIGGGAMAAPPLVNSERVAFAEKDNTIRILLKGLTGPIDGKRYSSVMPAMEANSDEWIADVVSYVRYEFGGRPPRRPGEIPGMAPKATDNKSGFPDRKVISPAVTSAEVKQIRSQLANRKEPFTVEELKKLSSSQ